jgi:tripartite-type tricarboxylate transporter receptor subunit TctC
MMFNPSQAADRPFGWTLANFRRWGCGLLAVAFLPMAALASAHAAYPEKPITVIVPFPPGGASDNAARVIAPKLQASLGPTVVIENRPGANGTTGSVLLKQAKPDGYTLLIGSIGVFAINPALYPRLQYDPRKDFELLTVLVRTPNVLVVNPKVAVKTVAELIESLKKNPEKVTFASSGSGSSDHLTTALFWQKTGTSGIHVPYKGGGQAVTDLMGGHAEVSFQNLGTILGHVKSGKLKALAVTSDKRVPALPDVPTLAEAGVQGLEVYSWQAAAGPKGLPAEVKTKLEQAFKAALSAPEVKARYEEIGFDVVGNTSGEFSQFMAAEIARWKEVIETGKITPD